MKSMFLAICISFLLFSQSVTVLISPDKDKFTLFEKELAEALIKLYNSNNSASLTVNFLEKTFGDMFPEIDKADASSMIMGIQTISINAERKKKYDFSAPYMTNRFTMTKMKNNPKQKTTMDVDAVIGALKGTIYQQIVIDRKYNTRQKFKIFDSKIDIANALKNKEIDFWLTDYIDIWTFDLAASDLKIGDPDKFGILFPKGSKLNVSMSKTTEYFLRSSVYYALIRKHLGEEAANYFQKGG
jgi:ABC-type amino acid transport substrate-binding protein